VPALCRRNGARDDSVALLTLPEAETDPGPKNQLARGEHGPAPMAGYSFRHGNQTKNTRRDEQ